MKNALILHCTDFSKDHSRVSQKEWFPWLKVELEKLGYQVWLPDLPEPWHPNIEKYWNYLKNFNFNEETIIIGHSSGASTVIGVLNKLPPDKKIALSIGVATFYKDEGWNCEGLFTQKYDWRKIKEQSKKIIIVYSDNDPYVKPFQAEYFGKYLNIKPLLMPGMGHFNLEAGDRMKQFPELLTLIKKSL